MSKVASKTSAKKAAGPSYEAMIKEAIIAHPEETRSGVGRQTIKKFLHKKHPETSKISEAAFNTLVSKAIARGAAKKAFLLPKGPSGKIKLAAPVKKTAAVKKPAAKKPAAKKPAAKKAAPAKKPVAKKPAAAKKTAAKPAAKKPVAKKPAAKKPAAAKKTTSSTAAKAKKPVAKKPAAKAIKKKAAPKKA